jgi:hypothetical protein
MAGTTLAAVAARPAMTRASAGELSDRFDIVVAGAGHNSLIAAAYLAKAGFRCLVLGGRPVVGGNCVTASRPISRARCVESPLDLERMNPHNWRGSCYGGAQNAAQSGNMRPRSRSAGARHRQPTPRACCPHPPRAHASACPSSATSPAAAPRWLPSREDIRYGRLRRPKGVASTALHTKHTNIHLACPRALPPKS